MFSDLSSLVAIPGVQQAAIADDAGSLLACSGEPPAPTMEWLVLAHATFSAAAELGRRSGSGECYEVIQRHVNGFICLHRLPHQRLLLVRCQSEGAFPMIRAVVHKLTTSPPPAFKPPPSSAVFDLASALHAEPKW